MLVQQKIAQSVVQVLIYIGNALLSILEDQKKPNQDSYDIVCLAHNDGALENMDKKFAQRRRNESDPECQLPMPGNPMQKIGGVNTYRVYEMQGDAESKLAPSFCWINIARVH